MSKLFALILCLFLITGCQSQSLVNISGNYTDHVYTNAYFNISALLDDEWSVDTDTIDFYAQKNEGFYTINVQVQYDQEVEKEEDLIDNYKSKIKSKIKSRGYILNDLQTGKESFAGQVHPYVYTDSTCEYEDGTSVRFYEKQYLIKEKEAIAIITLCSFREDKTGDLANLFQ